MRIAVLVERLTEMIGKMLVQPSEYLQPYSIELECRLIELSFGKIGICRSNEL